MSASSRLGKQIAQIVSALNETGVQFALIGGLALAPHKVIRATQDVDLLVDADDADTVERMVTTIGYRCGHRSAEAANYQRDDERLDFVYARRPIARRLLANAIEHDTVFGSLRAVSAEGIIGFKLQALVNDSRRTQDREDIKSLLRANRTTLNLEEVREFCSVGNRYSMKSSGKSPDTRSATAAEIHFAAEGGGAYPVPDNRDPFEALDDLMTVVEALCPRWPERDALTSGDYFRL